jgi:hypothetical protein
MWQLILSTISYKRQTIVLQLAFLLTLAAAANLILPVLGAVPSPEDDFKLSFFYPIVIVLGSLVVGMQLIVGNQHEDRLTLFATLPCTRLQLAIAYVLTPALLTYSCLLIGCLLMVAVQIGHGLPGAAWRFNFLAYFAGFCLLIQQLALFVFDFQQTIRRSPIARFVVLGLLIVFCAGQVLFSLRNLVNLELHPGITKILLALTRVNPESLTSVLIINGAAWFLMIVTTTLFIKRSGIEIDHHFSIGRLFGKNS